MCSRAAAMAAANSNTPLTRSAAKRKAMEEAKRKEEAIAQSRFKVLQAVATSSRNCTSPILASPTETEKHQMVQNYVDSIIPNRVYYEKTPTKEIISKLPRHTTFETMDDPSVKITMERQKEMPQKIVERIDYKDNENDETKPNDSNYNKEETHETQSYTLPSSLTKEEKREWIQNYINNITPSRVFYEKTPTKQIITRLPRPSILPTKDDPAVRAVMEKHKELPQKIIARVDYEEDSGNASASKTTKANEEVLEVSDELSFEMLVPTNIDLTEEAVASLESDRFLYVTKRSSARKRSTVEDKPTSDEAAEAVPVKKKLSHKSTEKEVQTQSDDLECPICFERLRGKKEVSATQCGHIFCTTCIRSSIQKKKCCPKCRKGLTLKKIHPLFL